MGAWVPVEYRPDDIIVMRRNPYYWKVDETGNQLPYLDEIHYQLSTWADRDVQAVAGTGDFSNLEQPENYVESLKRAADPNAPARLDFGAAHHRLQSSLNFSGNGWGEPDERGQAIRELNRNLDFRKAVTTAIDRQRLGELAGQGPVHRDLSGRPVIRPRLLRPAVDGLLSLLDLEGAKALLEKAGLTDTDGNGFVNFPADTGGRHLQVVLLANGDYQTDKNLAEGVVAMMDQPGIKVTLNTVAGNAFDAESQMRAGTTGTSAATTRS